MTIYDRFNFYFKKTSGDQNNHILDHAEGHILSDSHYVFLALARGVSVLNIAASRSANELASQPASQPARDRLAATTYLSGSELV